MGYPNPDPRGSAQFVPATGRVEGRDVIVSWQGTTPPRYVRYAWDDNPAEANLCNHEGWPAEPFDRLVAPPKAR